jgi:CRP-like cAMP-binding protein
MQTALIEPSLAESETLQSLPAGTPLFREGEEPRGVFVVRSGEVDISFTARDGTIKPLSIATAGQILGLSSVVMRRPHDCTAIARTRCELGFIDQDALLHALEDTPAVRFNVLRILSSEVNGAYDAMRNLSRR